MVLTWIYYMLREMKLMIFSEYIYICYILPSFLNI
jgi:hypothetical protein